jgi:hypothetical protein
MSVAAYELQVRQTNREQQWAPALEPDQHFMNEVLTAHRRTFPTATRPIAPPPTPVDRRRVFAEVWSRRKHGIPFHRLRERRLARETAEAETETRVRELQAAAEAQAASQQAALDEEWALLLKNDGHTVMAALEEAFEKGRRPPRPWVATTATRRSWFAFPASTG